MTPFHLCWVSRRTGARCVLEGIRGAPDHDEGSGRKCPTAQGLPFDDTSDFEAAQRGLIDVRWPGLVPPVSRAQGGPRSAIRLDATDTPT